MEEIIYVYLIINIVIVSPKAIDIQSDDFLSLAEDVIGQRGTLFALLLIAMFTEYCSYLYMVRQCAKMTNVPIARKPRKAMGIIFVVIAAGVLDWTVAAVCSFMVSIKELPLTVQPGVIATYIFVELHGILRNVERAGVPVPKWLIDLPVAFLAVIKTTFKNMLKNHLNDEDK